MASVLLGHDVETNVPVRLGEMERRQGLYIIGKTGTGKTTLQESLIVQDMESESGQGVCVLDPHGDLIDAVLARVPRSRESDVVLLDLADTQYPFGLNLFECQDLADKNLVGRVATLAVEVFEKLLGDISWGPQLAQVLRNCAYTLIENQGYTMAEIPLLLLDEQFRAKLVSGLSNEQARQFWELQYNPRSPRDRLDRIESTLNKVDEFLSPTALPIVGLGKSAVDFRRAMDQGAVVLVRLSLGQVGARTVSLVGSMIMGQLLNAALSRQELPLSERRQFNLYADEYHRFATPAIADLLAEARKHALATTLAHQFRGQLEDEANRGSTLHAANLVVFAVHREDGEELAKQFDRTPPPPDVAGQRPRSYSDVEAEIASTLVNLPKYQARCRLLEGNRTVEHTIHTPEFQKRTPSPGAIAMITRIRDRTRANYCAPLDEVLRAIGARQRGDAGKPPTTRRVTV